MFREMRRKRQALSTQDCLDILTTATSGVLAVSGDDGYPYTVPVSHVYWDGNLYFHCALEGHKIDGIRRSDKVSFCVIAQDEVVQKTFSTRYRSVVIFGRARILTADQDRRAAIERLVERFSPDYLAEGQKEIERDWERVCLVEIKIEQMTGKAALELVK